MRLCAVSVDLDEIRHYRQIHGLAANGEGGADGDLVYDLALDRLEAFSKAHELPLTLFVIGESTERKGNADKLRRLAADGFELGNHTYGHDYRLTRLARVSMRDEVERGVSAIRNATGVTPSGFRAPGYTMTDELFEVVVETGHNYDSSVFPSPAYYALKAAAIAAIQIRGRRSSSIVDVPQVLTAPVQPYRVGRPYWQRGSGLLEIPVQVTRGLRLPYIGTVLTAAGPTRARWLTQMVVGEPFVNLELHGIDVLDADDGLADLIAHQPDVRIPVARKLDALGAVVETLRGAGYGFVRLDEAAAKYEKS